jgi:hypothetical protein
MRRSGCIVERLGREVRKTFFFALFCDRTRLLPPVPQGGLRLKGLNFGQARLLDPIGLAILGLSRIIG